MRVLVTGWFGTEDGEITAGDALAGDAVRRWLAEAGVAHDVAMAAGFRRDGQLAPAAVDPAAYTHVLWVCGPTASPRAAQALVPFAHCTRIAVGTSTDTGPFDVVLARDGLLRPTPPRPDLSLGAPDARVPVVAVVLAHPQPEYGERQRHEAADALVRAVVASADIAPLVVDTRLDAEEALACSTAAQLGSLLARADAALTTRLHGLVLALRAGVPAVALDPIAGGAKVTAQAAALGWPAARTVDGTDAGELSELVAWSLSAEARQQAHAAAARGRAGLAAVREELLEAIGVAGAGR
ncbi:MAG TPA: polysaccharide pyruvyl transferase family protein [Solirubrobacteraceae bacterium]|nr:polysaccharide pyruvyl transferase family protein [Solirubrobacteraceae bacterium]